RARRGALRRRGGVRRSRRRRSPGRAPGDGAPRAHRRRPDRGPRREPRRARLFLRARGLPVRADGARPPDHQLPPDPAGRHRRPRRGAHHRHRADRPRPRRRAPPSRPPGGEPRSQDAPRLAGVRAPGLFRIGKELLQGEPEAVRRRGGGEVAHGPGRSLQADPDPEGLGGSGLGILRPRVGPRGEVERARPLSRGGGAHAPGAPRSPGRGPGTGRPRRAGAAPRPGGGDAIARLRRGQEAVIPGPGTTAASGARRSVLLLAAVCLLVNLPSLRPGFIHDDHKIIEQNERIRDLSVAPRLFLSGYWTTGDVEVPGLYRPVTILSFALNHAVSGLRPFPFRAINLLLHLLNTLL